MNSYRCVIDQVLFHLFQFLEISWSEVAVVAQWRVFNIWLRMVRLIDIRRVATHAAPVARAADAEADVFVGDSLINLLIFQPFVTRKPTLYYVCNLNFHLFHILINDCMSIGVTLHLRWIWIQKLFYNNDHKFVQ